MTMRKPIKYVYVAAPYNIPNPIHNCTSAFRKADILVECGFTPIIPHTCVVWNLVTPRYEDFWYAYTLDLMRLCDAVLRCPGESRGVEEECRVAGEIGIPVFNSIVDLVDHERA